MKIWLTKENLDTVQDPGKFVLDEQMQSIFTENGFKIEDLVKKDQVYASSLLMVEDPERLEKLLGFLEERRMKVVQKIKLDLKVMNSPRLEEKEYEKRLLEK